MSVIDLAAHRRARDAAPPETWRINNAAHINDHTDLYELVHERRELVEAGIKFMEGHVESFGPGGWAASNGPYRAGELYIANVLVVRFPDI